MAFGAVAQIDSQTSYIFGGQSSATGTNTNRLVRVTATSMTTVTTNGTAPTARRSASAVYLANCYGPNAPCLVVFGGTTTGEQNNQPMLSRRSASV